MCIEQKTQVLAETLYDVVLDTVDNMEEAKELIQENIRTGDSQIAHMAEKLFENQEKFGIKGQMSKVRTHRGTKLSALRGAIVLILQKFIDEEQAKIDKELLAPAATLVAV